MHHSSQQRNSGENKTRILIIDNHPSTLKGLTQLINQKFDLGICSEAEDSDHAFEAIEKRQVDFAIVDVAASETADVQLAEKIKLRYPALPLLILFIPDELLPKKQAVGANVAGDVIDQEKIEPIVRAIRYVESLLTSHVSGFTVFVKLERRVNNNHVEPRKIARDNPVWNKVQDCVSNVVFK